MLQGEGGRTWSKWQSYVREAQLVGGSDGEVVRFRPTTPSCGLYSTFDNKFRKRNCTLLRVNEYLKGFHPKPRRRFMFPKLRDPNELMTN